jgi:hypothetical protein
MAAKVVGEPVDSLTISPQKVVFVIEKAKEIDAKDVVTDPDPASNPADDKMVEVLEDHADDPARAEFAALIGSLNIDEQADLVALMWMGRDDYEAEDWDEVRAQAEAAHTAHTGRYLAGTPLLGDLLESGLDTLGYDVAELESEAF